MMCTHEPVCMHLSDPSGVSNMLEPIRDMDAGSDTMNMESLRAELAFPASYKSGELDIRRRSIETGPGGVSDDDGEVDENLMMMIMGTTPQELVRSAWRPQAGATTPQGAFCGRYDNGQPALRAQQVCPRCHHAYTPELNHVHDTCAYCLHRI